MHRITFFNIWCKYTNALKLHTLWISDNCWNIRPGDKHGHVNYYLYFVCDVIFDMHITFASMPVVTVIKSHYLSVTQQIRSDV